MRNSLRFALVLICLNGARTAFGDSGCGPRAWTDPAEAPNLRSILSAKDYADQLNAQLATSDPAQVTDQTPWAGAMISAVLPKSQAKLLGIKPGDVLVASNGEQVYNDDDWDKHREAGDETATYWSPASGTHAVTLQPGLIGVDLRSYFRPEVLYLRQLSADRKPDPVLFAAAACAEKTPELARAAAAHVRADGNDDQFVYFVDAIAASEEGNFDDCLASGMWAMNVGSDSEKQVLAPLMRSAALASFHLSLAEKLERDYPSIKLTGQIDEETGKDYTVELAKTIEQCDGISWNGPASCADAFAALNPTDQTTNMVNAGKAGAGGKQAAESIKTSRHVQFNPPQDHYEMYVLGPVAGDVQFSLRCRFSPNARNAKAQYGQAVKFGVSLKGSDSSPISMLLSPDGEVDVLGTDIPYFSYHLANAYTAGELFDVTMIVVGNRCEIDIGQVRAFYGPILQDEKKRKLCFLFHATDVKGQLNRVTWETAAPKP